VKKLVKLLAAVLALAMFAAACGSDSTDTAAVDTSAIDDALAEADAARAEAEQAKAAADAAKADADAAQAAIDDANAAKAAAEDAAAAAEADADAARAEADDAAAAASAAPAITTVTISGSERSEAEAGALNYALEQFGLEEGINIVYKGSANWETDIGLQLAAGANPDIGIYPQPGGLATAVGDGHVEQIPDDVLDAVSEYWSTGALGFGNVDGTQYGMPNKNDLKSLVWYQPARFEGAGYDIPDTLDGLWELADTMIADGNTPWCVGVESGNATGWAFTDWVEDMMLRTTTPENYDAWVDESLPFSSPEVTSVMEAILEQWNKEGAVFAAGGSIATTFFGANGEPLVNGDCFMHRQASFFSSFFPEGTPIADGSEGAVDVFYFPSNSDEKPVLGAGTLAAAFNDRPEVWKVMQYLGSPEFANVRQQKQAELKQGDSESQVASGFITANRGVDLDNWLPIEQSFIGIMQDAEIFRFDGSDLMTKERNRAFWDEGTAVVNGDKTVAEAAAAIDEAAG